MTIHWLYLFVWFWLEGDDVVIVGSKIKLGASFPPVSAVPQGFMHLMSFPEHLVYVRQCTVYWDARKNATLSLS